MINLDVFPHIKYFIRIYDSSYASFLIYFILQLLLLDQNLIKLEKKDLLQDSLRHKQINFPRKTGQDMIFN